MALYLKCTNVATGKEQRTKAITRGLTIGRGRMADIRLDGKLISRLHAFVFPRRDNRLELRDLSSAAGTFVIAGGEQIRLMPEGGRGGFRSGRAVLKTGDKFLVGGYSIEVCEEDVIGEAAWRRRFHEGLEEATREAVGEITQIDIDIGDY